MKIRRWFQALVVCGALAPFAACGGGAPSAPTPLSQVSAPTTSTTAVRLRITIPNTNSGTVGGKLRPAYVSPATQSAIINVTPQGSMTSVSGYPQTVNLTPNSAGCTSSLASTQCTLALAFAPGNYNATLTTYDQTGGSGNVLSTAQSVPFTVSSGAVNSIALILGGVPASVRIVPASSTLTGSVALGFTLTLNSTASAMLLALDADGNVIVGAGAPTVSASSSNASQVSVTEPTTGVPNTISLTSLAQNTSVTLTATVTPTASSGASVLTARAVVAPPLLVLPPRLYVTNFGNGTVTAYDLNGNQQTLSASISGLGNPVGIEYNSSNGFLYVSSGSKVTAYNQNGIQQPLSGSFVNLSAASGIAYDPANGFFYVADGNNATVWAYDRYGNLQTLSGTFSAVPPYPSGMAYDSSNGFLYVVYTGANTIKAYNQNGSLQTLSGSFPNLSSPIGIAYNSSNGFLYVTNAGNSTITAYDQNGNRQTLTGTFPNLNGPEGLTINR